MAWVCRRFKQVWRVKAKTKTVDGRRLDDDIETGDMHAFPSLRACTDMGAKGRREVALTNLL